MILYLCGYMGCGKSAIGSAAAKALKIGYVDLDKHIESTQKMTVSEIFGYGESHFRALETETLFNLGKDFPEENYIVSLGGGTICNKQNADFMNKNGVTVFIDLPFDICYFRIKNDRRRPIVQKETVYGLKGLYRERRKIYSESAKVTVDGSGSIKTVAKRIIEVYKNC